MKIPNICFVLLILSGLLIGCQLMELKEQIKLADNVGFIKGKVIVTSKQSGPVIIHRYFVKNKTYIADSFSRATAKGDYQFDTDPGKYYIVAYIDSNRDGYHQDNEDGNYYSLEPGVPEPVLLRAGKIVNVPDIVISGPPPELNTDISEQYLAMHIVRDISVPTNLNNPIFERKNYSLGMWKPFQFLKKIDGGIYFLQAYQPNKIPILFIHGINGGPLDWKQTIEKLDTERFQPWVLYYPTGLRLGMVSDYLVQYLTLIQTNYNFNQLYIVAHSMGGLVARSTVKKYLSRYPDLAETIKLLVTINSPLLGMESAGFGVDNSPLVLPVWRDLAPNSQFLANLNSWLVPEVIPYYLVFSWLQGSDNDGVVSLNSQIPFKIQSNTTKITGFNNSHVGTLHDKQFQKLLTEVLNQHK